MQRYVKGLVSQSKDAPPFLVSVIRAGLDLIPPAFSWLVEPLRPIRFACAALGTCHDLFNRRALRAFSHNANEAAVTR